jgi:hypothetical protein
MRSTCPAHHSEKETVLLKWKLVLTTLPFAVLITALAVIREHVLHIPGFLDFVDIVPILSGGVLIIGFMLSGVMADYKESERLPAQIVTALISLDDGCTAAIAAGKAVDQQAVREQLYATVTTTEDWLHNRVPFSACQDALNRINQITGALDRAGAGAYVVGSLIGTGNLRAAIARVQTVRDTSFIQGGYAFLDLLIGATMILLMVSGFKNPSAQYVVISLLSLIYLYLARLIRDLDNPFDYTPNGHQRSCAEVDLTPLREYRKHLESLLARNRHETAQASPVVEVAPAISS